MIEDKDCQIAWLTKSYDTLAEEVMKWEEWKASSQDRHQKGRTKVAAKKSTKPS